jgi:hypothetical protein
MYRGQKAQDHENFEADTPMADNRRADFRRRARVDRTRDFYRGRAHFWCASLRTGHLPDENIILEGHAFGVGAEKARGNRDYFLNKPYRAASRPHFAQGDLLVVLHGRELMMQ